MASPTNTQFAVAVHVLTYLAHVCQGGVERPVSSAELAASTQVSPVHVRRVLGPLRASGLLRSKPGPQGGWQLTRSPQAIPLALVYDVLRTDEPLLGLHGPSLDCPVGRGVHGVLEELDHTLSERVRSELAAITVADLLVRGGLAATSARA